jgi:dienelactone hydrolase
MQGSGWLIMTGILIIGAGLAAQTEPGPVDPLLGKAQSVVDDLAAGNFAKVVALFDATMTTALPEDKLRAAWLTVTQQAGAFRQRVSVTSRQQGELIITRVTCHFEKADLDTQVVFNPDGRIAGLAFVPPAPPWVPPAYATPSAYVEVDVTVGAPNWPLPGTLTVPVGTGPFPAVVLVHGSGPEDRDETILANKPFKDLALGLASHGIAVLRYEKRTQAYATKLGTLANFTVKEESVDDALAAVAKLREDHRIDPTRIFVLGHSLGGMLVPRIGAADPRIAGLIAMAGATRKLEDAMLAQVTYLSTASGPVTPDGQKLIDDMTKLVATVKALTPADAGNPKSISGAPAAYWLDLEAYDPVTAARTLPQPLLILQGERDYQVTMEDFARWQRGLAARHDVTYHTYSALNHLFIAGTGKSLPAEYAVPGHVDEAVIRDIAQWIANPHAPAGR